MNQLEGAILSPATIRKMAFYSYKCYFYRQSAEIIGTVLFLFTFWHEKRASLFWVKVAFLFLCATPFVNARAEDLPNLLPLGDWPLVTPHPGDASLEMIKNGDATYGDVLRVTVNAPSDPVWLIQTGRNIPAAVPAGHLLHLHFWAKSSTLNPLRVAMEESAAPYHGIAGNTVNLTADWKEYAFSGPSLDPNLNSQSVKFQVGRQAGTVEIADVSVTDSGPEVIPPAVLNALKPEQILARIEKYRKGDLTIKVEDAGGHPVKGASVKITETRAAFLFGANIFALNVDDPSPLQIAYQKDFTALFNYATLPFYWGTFEHERGHPDYNHLDKMARWSLTHNLVLKGHPLIYHQVWPAWAPVTADDTIPLLKARVFDIIQHFKGEIHYWDVLNEANSAADDTTANGESNWIRRDSPATVVSTALDWARAAKKVTGTDENFIYNDNQAGQANIDLLTKLQVAGKLPDIIGIQSHMHEGTWPMNKVWQVCETFAQFGRPIHFTETTVLSGPKRKHLSTDKDATDWNSTPEEEAKQADYVAQFYTLLFSHPSVRAITWWDLSDKDTWMGAPGGLVHKDMSPKPAYTRLMDLIHHQWWTDTEGSSDDAGAFTTRVFYGDYQVTVTSADGKTKTQSLTFPESASPLSVTIQLP
ncbi:MAG: endo-1,4-beta-xylanase [Chthoniobacterales bacterium]